MKLPAQQMHELNDAQLNFEALQKLDVLNHKAADFLQDANNLSDLISVLAALKNLKLTWGILRTNNPATIASAGSGDWSVAGSVIGTSTLTYPTRVGVPAVLVAPATSANFSAQAGTIGTTSAIITTFTANTGVAVGTATSFIVLGI